MKKTLLSLALATACAAGAFASPLALPSGPLYFQFTNLEQTALGVNANGAPLNNTDNCPLCSHTPEGNWGVAQISVMRAGAFNPTGATAGQLGNDIVNMGTTPFFSDQLFPVLGGEITAMFHGSVITSNVKSGSTNTLQSTGGFIDLYWDEPGLAGGGSIVNINTLLPSGRCGDACFTGITDGIFLGRLAFASGINPLAPTTFLQGTIDTSKVGDAGSADSYANVVDVNGDGKVDSADGLWAGQLNTDWFGTVFGTRDVRFSNHIVNNPAWNSAAVADNGIFGQTSNDPGRGVVSEPGSLALAGLGLLGLLGLRRRQRT